MCIDVLLTVSLFLKYGIVLHAILYLYNVHVLL